MMNYLLLMCSLGLAVACAAALATTSSSSDAEYSLMSPKVTESLMIDVAQAGSRLIAVGERGHIIYSDNQGRVWTQAKVPTRVLMTAVFFTDEHNGWAVGHDAMILHTSDGGESWVEQYSDRFSLATDEEEWVDEIDRSGTPLMDLWFKNSKQGFAVGAYGYFLHTMDGGETWLDWTQHIDNEDGWHFNSVAVLQGGVLLVVGEKGIIYRSRDEGQSWEQLPSPYDGSFFGVVATKSPDVALIFGLQGKLYRTVDQGDTWAAIDSGVQTGLNSGIVLNDGTVYIVGNGGVVLKSHDGGKQFLKTIRKDRKSLVGISPSSDGTAVIFVGQGGVKSLSLVNKDTKG